MERRHTTITLIGAIYLATIVVGVLSFYLAGGIPMLASDVGLSGAWGLLVLFQFIYSTLSVLAFLGLLYFAKKQVSITPSLIPTVISASLISIAVNLYGIHRDGPGVDFIYFCLIFVGLSALLFAIIARIFNSLTKLLC